MTERSCSDCVCMVRRKRNWCRPSEHPDMNALWPPRWRALKWVNGVTSIVLEESEFGIAKDCRMYNQMKTE